jgi:hypothetical protein
MSMDGGGAELGSAGGVTTGSNVGGGTPIGSTTGGESPPALLMLPGQL